MQVAKRWNEAQRPRFRASFEQQYQGEPLLRDQRQLVANHYTLFSFPAPKAVATFSNVYREVSRTGVIGLLVRFRALIKKNCRLLQSDPDPPSQGNTDAGPRGQHQSQWCAEH